MADAVTNEEADVAVPVTNWAGNVTFAARHIHRPASVDELRRIVGAATRIRALGTGHSFNRLADTDAELVSLAGLPTEVVVDPVASTVTAGGGIRYGELAEHLHTRGYALHNLASLPHISVAGACATATHGSGQGNGNLATAVRGIELVTAAGDLVALDRSDPDFAGVVVGLGGLGVVTSVTLAIEPTFEIAQYVYQGLSRDALADNWARIAASGYSVSLFTGWSSTDIDQVWVKRRIDRDHPPVDADGWGLTAADGPRHPVPGMPVDNCTSQLGVAGPWHTRLPHFRLDFTPSSGAELQSEYLVPVADAVAALDAVAAIRDQIAPVLQICEIRTIAADELWLSMNHRRDGVAIHFTWIADTAAVAPVIAAVEQALAPFAPRPHWGKLFGIAPDELAGRYERWNDFAQLLARHDPAGVFRNDFLDRYFPR
ncbi:D-arabinono-1,4-lactone oxidase [Micromonospora sp. NBC_01813]|uniref:D-arabinono-1,4-lactone oxidase n=1 Tax=Micromonospora sp. NBC_01813 TaxID=2975988 RepID=UPI002DD8BEC5|nr:D-arabinono-1,4-lactone oxidase [Micromonospora sp. NBC_01813]WSA09402.1 FAD-binding protein [Micromonospora sp. NBC_01813]